MNDPKKVWIDPKDCGLPAVEAAERKRREAEDRKRKEETERQQRELERQRKEEAMRRQAEEEQARTQALTKQPKPEFLPPSPEGLVLSSATSKSLTLPAFDCEALALPDLTRLERQIRDAADTLDLSLPEGFLDRWFGRPNHRIAVKTERGELLAGYISACSAILEEARKAMETEGALQRAKHQIYIERLVAQRTAMQEYYKLELARRQVLRQDAVEDAKAKFEVEQYAANAEITRRSALPPAPITPPVDEATRKREATRRSRQEQIDMHLEEQEEWAAASEESVARARTRCIEIYCELNARDGDKRARIQRVLDHYNLDASILPVAIEELMIRAYEEVQE
ncbi:MAG: hypothetical protein LAO07_18190 [Acidobacteriia bacterium]|nr:hypothetical protein [Terriglobia bacterium]